MSAATRAATETAPNRAGARSGVWLLALALGLALIGWAAYRAVFVLPHLGWDTWPMIATARIESWSDFFGTFTEKLMDGRYPLGDFYRPVTNLSVACDYALWGTDPVGYHVTDFAILIGSAWLTAVLVARLFGSRCGATLAALVFVLHPVHWESLPVTARRADTLSVFFVLTWLVALPLGRSSEPAGEAGSASAGPGSLRALAVFLLALAAVGAKETGALVVGLVAVLLALAPAATPRRRLAPAAISTLVAVGLFVAARTAVLGGLGGHGQSSIAAGFQKGPGLFDEYAGMLLVPQPWFAAGADNARLALGVAIGLGIALLLGGLGRGAGGALDRKVRLRGLAFLGLWLAGLLVLTGISGEVRSWYSIPFLPIWCGLVGAAAAGAVNVGQQQPAWAALAGLLTLATALVPLRFTGLLHEYADWREVGGALEAFFVQVEAELGQAHGGQVIQLPSPPAARSAPRTEVGVRMASGIADYGIQAWADVSYAPGAVRVHDARRGPTRQAASEILLVLMPPRPLSPR